MCASEQARRIYPFQRLANTEHYCNNRNQNIFTTLQAQIPKEVQHSRPH